MSRGITSLSVEERRALMSRLVQDPAPSCQTRRPSILQERLWFLDQLQPGLPIYNMAARRRWPGELDLTALEHSLAELVRRHEILRTTFAASPGGGPVQVIGPPGPVPLRLVDLCHLPATTRDVEAARVAEREARSVFDLQGGPLLRTALVRLGEHDHLLLITLHASIGDQRSLGLLLGELDALYQARVSGQPAALGALPRQFGDWAEQERGAGRDAMAADLAYWRARLADAPAALDLPVERPRQWQGPTPVAWHPFELGTRASVRLRQLAHAHRATPFMVLLASLAALLHRYTGQSDLVIGSMVDHRHRPGLDRLIGPLTNSLALRVDAAGDPCVIQLLARVRTTVLEACAHQRVPFELVLQELHAERAFAHGSPVQIMLALEQESGVAEPGGCDRLGPVREPAAVLGAVRLDLSVRMREHGACYRGVLEYNAGLFEPETIARLADHFERLIAAAVEQPEMRVSELPLLSEAERAALHRSGQAPDHAAPGADIEARIAQHARRAPAATAVRHGAASLSYGELERRSAQLAAQLAGRGVGADTRVGLCMRCSPDLVVAVLAILRAGGAVVPLDPGQPERLAAIIADAELSIVLGNAHITSLAAPGVAFIGLDEAMASAAAHSAEPLAPPSPRSSVAAVLYGSRGACRPRGALLDRRSLSHVIDWYVDTCALGADARALVAMPLVVSLCLPALLAPLAAGSTLVLADGAGDADEFVGIIEREQATTLTCLPGALAPMLDRAHRGQYQALSSLRTLLVPGPRLAGAVLGAWLFSPACACTPILVHTAAESADVVCARRLGREHMATPGRAPVAELLPHLEAQVLDAQGNPQPVGVPGELCVAGPGVGRGILGRSDLSARARVAHPFRPGATLVRSGERVRRRPDGALELLGRIGEQVDILGMRIDPAEIEAVLERHPAVREAGVSAHEELGALRLVAYVVPHGSAPPGWAELRRHCKSLLPAYLIPPTFALVDALPRGPGGDVERGALVRLNSDATLCEQPFEWPRTPVEQVVARIWSDVLGVEPIGIHDDFFELGGHSLMATEAVSRLGDALRMEVPLARLAAAPTVASLCASLLEADGPTRQRIERLAAIRVTVAGLADDELEAMLQARR